MNILVLDNYDSFTYNLVHILCEMGVSYEVKRNDKLSISEVEKYDKILLSPGPGIPSEAGLMKEIISTYAPSKSILGVCLGHQGIAEVFGATLFNMEEVCHGTTGELAILSHSERLFDEISNGTVVGLYHSWAVDEQSIPKELEVTSKSEKGVVMSLQHRVYDAKGVQFHPESILTQDGKRLIKNWLKK